MIDRKRLFDTVRPLFVKYNAKQIQGIDAIIDEYEQKYSEIGIKGLAYCLATVFHETAKTMQPIVEFGKGKGRPYGNKIRMDRKPYTTPDQLYYGRGFVQLTWYENYQKAGKKFGIDLLNNPDLACDLQIATDIMFEGMIHGWFTGRKLSQYFSATKTDWINARKIINGRDKDVLIAGYAQAFFNGLK